MPKGKKETEPEAPAEVVDNESDVSDPPPSPAINECVETSWLSQDLWKKSLRKGCLNKTLNKKPKLYSYVRALTRRQNLSLGSILGGKLNTSKSTPDDLVEVTQDANAAPDTDFTIVERPGLLYSPDSKSPVIAEDVLEPPRVKDEKPTMFFTDLIPQNAVLGLILSQNTGDSRHHCTNSKPIKGIESACKAPKTRCFNPPPEKLWIKSSRQADEFFSFMSTPGNEKPWTFRVAGGQLLKRLLTTLYVLEARGLVCTNDTHAYLNSGYWRPAPKNDAVDNQEPKKSMTEWVSEKILIRMIYYSRVREPMDSGKSNKRALDMALTTSSISESTQSTSTTTRLRSSTNQLTSSTGRLTSSTSRLTSSINSFTSSTSRLTSTTYPMTSSTNQLTSSTVRLQSETNPIMKLVPRAPMTHRVYSVDKLKLPPEEDQDPKARIAQLEDELKKLQLKEERRLLAIAAASKVKDGKGDKAKATADEPQEKLEKGKKAKEQDFEDIAEDPYLVPEGAEEEKRKKEEAELAKQMTKEQIPEETPGDDSKVEVQSVVGSTKEAISEGSLKEAKSKEEMSPRTTETKLSEEGVEKAASKNEIKNGQEPGEGKPSTISVKSSDQEQMKKATSQDNQIAKKSVDRKSSKNGTSRRASKKSILSSKTSTLSSTSSSTSTRSLSRKSSGEKKKMYLSGTELNVSGLYSERAENAQSTANRLHQSNKVIVDQRYQNEKKKYREFYLSKDVDLGTRFKHLAEVIERERRKATGPQIHRKKRQLSSLPKIVEDTKDKWSKYYEDQEGMEMRVATDNQLQIGVMKRLAEKPKVIEPIVDETKIKKKGKRNINKSNNFNTNVNYSHNAKPGSENDSRKKNVRFDDLEMEANHGNQMVGSKPDTFPIEDGGIRQQTLNELQSNQTSQKFTILGDKPDKSKYLPLPPIASRKALLEEDSKKNLTWMGSTPCKDFENDFKHRSQTVLSQNVFKRNVKRAVDSGTQRPDLVFTSKKGQKLKRPNRKSANEDDNIYKKSESLQSNQNETSTRSPPGGDSISGIEQQSNEKMDKQENENGDLETEDGEMEDQDELSTATPSPPPGPTESEILRQDLARFKTTCECCECIDDENFLKSLQPDCRDLPFTYPVKLGCLRRSFEYSQVSKESVRVFEESEIVSNQDRGDAWFQDEFLALLNKMVVRKDIIVSNLGKTFTTVVFSK